METLFKHDQTIIVPTYGPCTLLSLDAFPPDFRSYAHMRTTARELGLSEIGAPNHVQLQVLAKALARHLKGEDSYIMISGVLRAYPEIRHDDEGQEKEKCVIGLVLSTWPGQEPLEPWLEYVPVHQVRESSGDGRTYCLFLGT